MLRRQLLAAEEQETDVDRAGRGLGEVADELERDRDASFHVARAAAVHRPVLDSPGKVVLRWDRVVVACEDEERDVGTPVARPEERLVTFVDRLERHGTSSRTRSRIAAS